MSDYEEATSFLGEWGRFQQQVFFLLCLTVVPNGFTALSMVFVADTPLHRCVVPPRVNLTAAWRNSSIPLEEDGGGELVPSKCLRYKLDDLLSFSERGLVPGVDVNLSEVPKEGCLDGWDYDQSLYTSTIITEWNMVCDDRWKNPLTSSVFFSGVLAGSIISGQLSDRYGRKIVLFVTLAFKTVFALIKAVSPSWPVFCALYFVVGMGHISNYVSAFVLGTEILGPRVRTIFSTMGVSLFFGFGYMLLPLVGFFIRDWRMLILALNLPGLLCLPFWWFIPESPRWLLSQGRVEEAEAIVRDAARRNKIEPPPVIFSPLQNKRQSEERTTHNICDLLRSRNICGISLTLWLVWNSLTIGYFALSLNTANLHGNAYFNCFLSAVVELPAYTLSWVLFRWVSRRLSIFSTLSMGGLSLLFIQLVPASTMPRPDSCCHNAGDDGEVCRVDSLRHRVRLHSRSLPNRAEEHSHWRLLHGLPIRQHHGSVLHLLEKLFRIAALHPHGKFDDSGGVAESPAARELWNASARNHHSHATLPWMLSEDTLHGHTHRGRRGDFQ